VHGGNIWDPVSLKRGKSRELTLGEACLVVQRAFSRFLRCELPRVLLSTGRHNSLFRLY